MATTKIWAVKHHLKRVIEYATNPEKTNDEDFNFAQKYYDKFQDCLSPTFRFYLSVGNDNTKEDGDISKRILKSYEWLINKVAESSMNKVYILPQIHTLVWGNKQGV